MYFLFTILRNLDVYKKSVGQMYSFVYNSSYILNTGCQLVRWILCLQFFSIFNKKVDFIQVVALSNSFFFLQFFLIEYKKSAFHIFCVYNYTWSWKSWITVLILFWSDWLPDVGLKFEFRLSRHQRFRSVCSNPFSVLGSNPTYVAWLTNLELSYSKSESQRRT